MDSYNGETNVINNYSYNHGTGCYKPDVVATSRGLGTCFSTPCISRMIALMYQYKPSLSASPETTKAILLASSHEKCNKVLINGVVSNLNETLYSGLTNRQGAGIPNMYRMISIISQHTYGNGVLNNSNNYSRTVKFLQPSYDSGKINISMAYLQTDVPVNNGSGTINDYDISVVNNGTTKYSNKSNSSTEMVYKDLTSDSKYTLNISKNSGNTNSVRYAYAWSTNNEHYYNNYDNEGVYYLKNLKSSYYLTKNTNNSYTSQTSFSNSNNLLWVLDKPSSNSDYVLKNANITSNGLGFGSLIETDDYYAIEGSNASNQQIEVIFDQNTGAYSFVRTKNGIDYALGIYNNSTSSGSYADWKIYSPTNASQKWHLEKANYRRGDVNLDGSITTADSAAVLNYYAYLNSGVGTNPFKNIQIFLADVNCDGIVNSVDSSLIASMAA